jgi:hypothetical protein
MIHILSAEYMHRKKPNLIMNNFTEEYL